jgi:hypothetical protein
MAFNFTPPVGPAIGQVYSPAVGYNWVWNGDQWEPFVPALSVAPATAGSFNAGGAATFGTNPINITAVTPYRAQFSLVNTPGLAGQVLASNGQTGEWVTLPIFPTLGPSTAKTYFMAQF